jgi:ATP-dependent RNA circularization protein (DNA/RNA ligase family)
VNDSFHKFPHTPHLIWLGEGTPREDKVLSKAEAADFLSGEVVVEEKVDGANLGLSVGPDGRLRAQSRGNFLNPSHCHAQWKPLWPWLAKREDEMAEALGSDLMLFGEWCYAEHTVPYDGLPDWFLSFDVFEISSRRFWSTRRRNDLLCGLGIVSVPEKHRGRGSPQQLPKLIGKSELGSGPAEGIYLRREDRDYLLQRAKVVGPAFKQQIVEHWTRKPLVPNTLASKQVFISV